MLRSSHTIGFVRSLHHPDIPSNNRTKNDTSQQYHCDFLETRDKDQRDRGRPLSITTPFVDSPYKTEARSHRTNSSSRQHTKLPILTYLLKDQVAGYLIPSREQFDKLSEITTANKLFNMTMYEMSSRGPVTPEQLKQDLGSMTFGIELECIAVYPKGLFDNDERNRHGDAMSALSLGCLDKGVQATGHEHIDDEEEFFEDTEAFSCWCFQDEGGLHLSAKEREALGPNLEDYTIQPIEVSSRLLLFRSGDWQEEIATVLSVYQDLRERGVRFITNSTTGFHMHVGFGTWIMPLRTAKNVLELCTGFEDRLDALYSTSRIDENAAINFPAGHHFNAGLAWHFQNNKKTDFGPNIFHWLVSIEEASSFAELGNLFRNNIPDGLGYLSRMRRSSAYPITRVRMTDAHYSTLNLDNLYMSPYSSEIELMLEQPTVTIEFRQHGGTLDFETIVSHILLNRAMVNFCHISTDKDFLQLFAHISNPTFRLNDLIGAIGGCRELLEYHEERRSYATAQAKEEEYKATMEDLKEGEFDYSPLLKLGAQAFIEESERSNWTAVSNRIHAKHQAGAYAQMQTRDLDIASEWDKFVWFNCDKFSGDEMATLARVMVFQQLNGDDMEFDCGPEMFPEAQMEDAETDCGETDCSCEEMFE